MDGSSKASDVGQETEASDESLQRAENISELSSKEDSDADLKPSSTISQKKKFEQTRRMHTKSQESHNHSRNEKGSYIVSAAYKKVQDKAKASFVDALNQVPDEDHFNLEDQRTRKTLHVGNLD